MIAPGARRWRPLTAVLGFLCLGLGGVVAVELTAGDPAPLPADAPAGRASVPAGAPVETAFAMPPASAYDDIVERPLFSDTRRPSAVAADGSREANPSFVLVGTIVSEQSRDALIRHGQPARVDHVAEGQSIDGWTVRSILPDRVVFTNAASRLEIKAKD